MGNHERFVYKLYLLFLHSPKNCIFPMFDDNFQGWRPRRIRSHVPNQLLPSIANIEEHSVMGGKRVMRKFIVFSIYHSAKSHFPWSAPFCSFFFVCLFVYFFIFWLIFSSISTERLREGGWVGGARADQRKIASVC